MCVNVQPSGPSDRKSSSVRPQRRRSSAESGSQPGRGRDPGSGNTAWLNPSLTCLSSSIRISREVRTHSQSCADSGKHCFHALQAKQRSAHPAHTRSHCLSLTRLLAVVAQPLTARTHLRVMPDVAALVARTARKRRHPACSARSSCWYFVRQSCD